MELRKSLLGTAILATVLGLAGCDGDDGTDGAPGTSQTLIELNVVGSYQAEGEVFDESAAEIVAHDPSNQRLFVVNALASTIDVLDINDPAMPVKLSTIDATAEGAAANSVAVYGDLVAVAIEAENKQANGKVVFYNSTDLNKVGEVVVGALPDMVTFTRDGMKVLVANEGEPSTDYQIDPVGSISILGVSEGQLVGVRTAGFSAFNTQADALRSAGVRIYGPNASVEQDLEPEYIAISSDSSTAWVSLQENNALAKVDIATATVTDILPLGYKDHGTAGNGLDVSDSDDAINIDTWPGVLGMYQPDSIAAYEVDGETLLVTANEGDSRAWGEDDQAYWDGDASKGFVEEFRVKHLVHVSGFDRRAGDDLPPQLRDLAAGALLNPTTFAYCGATAADPGDCRDRGLDRRLPQGRQRRSGAVRRVRQPEPRR